ncbi:UNVERIFIED_CONTAM: hypothetical protein NCL1_34031 [Trichonephila clavipes]
MLKAFIKTMDAVIRDTARTNETTEHKIRRFLTVKKVYITILNILEKRFPNVMIYLPKKPDLLCDIVFIFVKSYMRKDVGVYNNKYFHIFYLKKLKSFTEYDNF